MIYDHIVKINDEYYPAGVDVPIQCAPEKEVSIFDAELENEPVKRGRPKKN